MQHSHSRWQIEPVRSRRCLFPILCVAAALPWLAPACAAPEDAAHDTESSHESRTGVSTRDLAADVEIALDPPFSASAPGAQPAVAFDGTSYFAVWSDFRPLRPRLYGARLAADGTVLDPFGILLDDGLSPSHPYYTPAVAFDGTSYLVTFLRNGTIVGLRVSPGGEVLDASPFPISAPNTVAFEPEMAFDGENLLLVWSHQDQVDPAATGIYVARVSPEGTVLDPGGVLLILIPLSGQSVQDVVFDGENYFLSWIQDTADGPMVMGARLTTAGALLDPEGFPIQQGATGTVVEVSFDGTNHVVVWSAYDDEEYNELLYATRVTPEGTVLEPSEITLGSFNNEGSRFSRVAATATSAGTIVASSREGYTAWQEIHLALVPVQGDAVLLPEGSFPRGVEVALATGGDGALALWTASFSNPNYTSPDQRFTPIVAQRLRADATSIDAEPFFVSRGASAQDVRAVASDGQRFFVLWTDSRDPATEGRSLYGARVSADGTVLDPAGILVTQEEAGVVDVVFDGTNYLVIFVLQIEGSDNPLRGVRVSPQGQVLDTLSIELPLCSQSPSDHTPRAAAAGDRMLLVANGCDFETLALAAVVIDREGGPLSTPVALVHVDDRRQVNAPEVASDGAGYLVVWNDDLYTVYGRRVDAAGAPIGEAFPITSAPDTPPRGRHGAFRQRPLLRGVEERGRHLRRTRRHGRPGAGPAGLPHRHRRDRADLRGRGRFPWRQSRGRLSQGHPARERAQPGRPRGRGEPHGRGAVALHDLGHTRAGGRPGAGRQ